MALVTPGNFRAEERAVDEFSPEVREQLDFWFATPQLVFRIFRNRMLQEPGLTRVQWPDHCDELPALIAECEREGAALEADSWRGVLESVERGVESERAVQRAR